MSNDRSRLSKRLESKTKRNMILTIIGIAVLLYFLFSYGINSLANLSLYFSGGQMTPAKRQDHGYIAAPALDSLPNATNSASIIISGSGSPKETIKLFVNGDEEEETTTDEKGEFSFRFTKLKRGENTIKTRAVTEDKKESEFSSEYKVAYLNKPPSLSIDSPSDGQIFEKDNKTANVAGKTDPKTKVYVNDFWAIVDEDGNYSYSLPLKAGENKIKITVTDEASNKTEKEIKVIFNP